MLYYRDVKLFCQHLNSFSQLDPHNRWAGTLVKIDCCLANLLLKTLAPDNPIACMFPIGLEPCFKVEAPHMYGGGANLVIVSGDVTCGTWLWFGSGELVGLVRQPYLPLGVCFGGLGVYGGLWGGGELVESNYQKIIISTQIAGTRAEPQRIVAQRLLSRLQYPVPNVSRLQRI